MVPRLVASVVAAVLLTSAFLSAQDPAPEVSVNIESLAQGLTRVTFSPDGLGRSGSLEAKVVSVSYRADGMTIRASDGTLALPTWPSQKFTTAELTFEKGKYTGVRTKTDCCQ